MTPDALIVAPVTVSVSAVASMRPPVSPWALRLPVRVSCRPALSSMAPPVAPVVESTVTVPSTVALAPSA